jgi:hypothetical protein
MSTCEFCFHDVDYALTLCPRCDLWLCVDCAPNGARALCLRCEEKGEEENGPPDPEEPQH